MLAALDQRIAVRYHMPGMTLEETTDYLRHHLHLAGRSDTLFSDDAAALLHQTSRRRVLRPRRRHRNRDRVSITPTT